MSGFEIRSLEDLTAKKAEILKNSSLAIDEIRKLHNDPLLALFDMKFRQVGFHPTSGHRLNLIEQLNQTFTYICALEACGQILQWHEDIGGLSVYPGAHAPPGSLDIEALEKPGYLGAELFSAVNPNNNRKLLNDLEKLRDRDEKYRYEFFICPTHPETKRQTELERFGVKVWSIWPFGEGF